MKHTLTALILMLLAQLITAQEFDIRSFKAIPTDLAARRNVRYTINDEACALVKIITNIKGMQFDANQGIQHIEHKEDGYWLYISPRERRIRLMATSYLSIDAELPEPAQSFMVYELIVASKGSGLPASDVVQVTFRMNQSDVMIRSGNMAPIPAPGNTAVRFLPKGQHTFTFSKQGFNDKELTITVQEVQIIDVELVAGTTTTQLALPGWIIVESQPSGAEVFLNDQRVGVTPYQGRHIAGEYSIMLRYHLYYDHQEQFNLNEGATVNIPPVTLKPRFGHWQVTSTPTGAEVILNNRSIGSTPLARMEISSGNHELKIRKDLYHEHQENFTIEDGDDKTFNIELKAAFGHLKIDSEPKGAKVFIEGDEVGVTPYENPQQPSGTWNIRLSTDLYSDTREEIVVRDGQLTDRFIPLTRNFGTLKVTASDAEIFINNSRVGSGSYTANLTPGQYKVKATRPLHIDAERDVSVIVGQTEEITLTPLPRQGALIISSQPFETRGAEIFINDRKRSETTPATIPLLIGNYKVAVKKSGFLDNTRQVEIREGQEHELVFNMQTFEGSILQKARRHKTAKIIYGTATIAAVGAGAYFSYSAMTLADDYKAATSDATTIYNRYEDHNLYSYIAFGAAVPLGILTIVKAVQQKKTMKNISVAAVPVGDGVMLGLVVKF